MLKINKVYCMDCLDGMKQIDDASVDLIITDPPYDVDYMKKVAELKRRDHGTVKHITASVDTTNNQLDFHAIIKEMYRILKPNTHLYCFFAEKQSHIIIPIFEEAGFKFVQYLIWVKNRCTPDLTYGHKYMYQHELCGFFQKGWSKIRSQHKNTTVIEYAIRGEQLNYLYPTQKPLPIIRRFVENSSDEGMLVCDPFMGSGTTALACKQFKRNFIGFEIAQNYVDIINNRLKQSGLNLNKLDAFI